MGKYVIVGNGVAGVTAARAVVSADPAAEVHVYGAEPYPYYRRPLLWEFIAGQTEQDALYFRSPDWYAERSIHLHLGIEAVELDTSAHRLALTNGATVEYDRLLLATGGRPFVPGTGAAYCRSGGDGG
jgi:NAD(P)H-nitrite reductase large subunit